MTAEAYAMPVTPRYDSDFQFEQALILLRRGGPTISGLSQTTGVPQASLSRWKHRTKAKLVQSVLRKRKTPEEIASGLNLNVDDVNHWVRAQLQTTEARQRQDQVLEERHRKMEKYSEIAYRLQQRNEALVLVLPMHAISPELVKSLAQYTDLENFR